MKNHLAETVDAIASTLKKCCPSAIDNNYHLRAFHEHDESNLLLEKEDTECKICACNHATERCPCSIHLR